MFDRLKKLFVVEDPNAVKDNQDQESQSTVTESRSTFTKSRIEIDNSEVSNAPDPKFIDILLKAIDSNNMDGFDYLEFKQTLQGLANVNTDETTKYSSALAMAKTMGSSKDFILKSAGHYLDVLKREESKFSDALQAQKLRIESNQNDGLVNLEKSIVQKKAQVEKLLAEIKNDEANLLSKKDEISQDANKLQATAANFKGAYSLVTNQIIEDAEKIKNIAI